MSVMLIRPMTPTTSHTGIVSIQYPINIGYLVSYLKKHGIECHVLDFEVEEFKEEFFIYKLNECKPEIVGFSCMTPHITAGGRLAGIVKKHFSDILTVAGGVHASAIPEKTLEEFAAFDVIVRGEGEATLRDLYHSWTKEHKLEGVEGIYYRENGNSVIKANPSRLMIKDLDDIPFPDRELADINLYKKSHVSRGFSRQTKNIAEIMGSRGCPYQCIFCASQVVHTRNVRFRTPENIIEEMEHLINKYGAEHFSFLDDTFTIKRSILYNVCEYMRFKNVTFDCFTRVNDIDEEKLKAMVNAGCKKVSFGIESGSPKMLKLLKKGQTIEQIERAFCLVKDAGIKTVEATFMIGNHPDETREDIEMTRKLIYRVRPDIMGIFITIPYPGTELNRILKERGLLRDENWDEFKLLLGRHSWELGEIPMDELEKILKNITNGYYLSLRYIVSTLMKIRNLYELKYWVRLGLSFVKARFS